MNVRQNHPLADVRLLDGGAIALLTGADAPEFHSREESYMTRVAVHQPCAQTDSLEFKHPGVSLVFAG